DPLAHHFVRRQDAHEMARPSLVSRLQRRLRLAVAARSHVAEAALAEAVARGVRQYVVLGAGFDTFALRSPFSHLGLQVYEVDHPATQRVKRQMVADAGLTVPATLRWTPADFSRQQ